MTSIVLLNDVRCKALFDTSVSYSFISRSFTNSHGIDIAKAMNTRWVQIPDHAFLCHGYLSHLPSADRQLDIWIIPANLLMLKPMEGFDLVLDMDCS